MLLRDGIEAGLGGTEVGMSGGGGVGGGGGSGGGCVDILCGSGCEFEELVVVVVVVVVVVGGEGVCLSFSSDVVDDILRNPSREVWEASPGEYLNH